jgi:hypothetical protein
LNQKQLKKMPQLKDRLVKQLMAKGMEESRAYATAHSVLRRTGSLTKKGKLTPKGKQRQAMGAAGRAKERAARYSGGRHSPSDYVYNASTNTATLTKK